MEKKAAVSPFRCRSQHRAKEGSSGACTFKRHKSARPAKSRLATVGRDFTKLCEWNTLHLPYVRIVPALGLIRRDDFFFIYKNFTYLQFLSKKNSYIKNVNTF